LWSENSPERRFGPCKNRVRKWVHHKKSWKDWSKPIPVNEIQITIKC
jgi:hypothetical protein